MGSHEAFVKYTEKARRERQMQIDGGNEYAKLKFMQPNLKIEAAGISAPSPASGALTLQSSQADTWLEVAVSQSGFFPGPNIGMGGWSTKPQVCRQFQRSGFCSYGDRCKFRWSHGSFS